MSNSPSRRQFLQASGIAAATTLVAGGIPHVHAAEDHTIQLALIGCGGRGGGAAANALAVKNGPIKLVAMADLFRDRAKGTHRMLSKQFSDKVDVPEERIFDGFEAYRQAMDCLKPGDIAIFASPPAFRWVHFAYAIEKGLNVFMEKPVTVDGPTTHKMLKLAEQSAAKNLKVGVGLMSRHQRGMEELARRIADGEIGDLLLMRGYRMHGPIGGFNTAKFSGASETGYQVSRFHSFLWASGGTFSDFYIHIIDHCCWMKNAWPVQALALGGRHYRGNSVDQNFDTYSVEYSFADDTRLIMNGRCINGCTNLFSSAAHGTKGTAVMSRANDCGGPSAMFKGLGFSRESMFWEAKVGPGEGDPYQNEWNDLVAAIRGDKPYNEAQRGAEASLVTSMGRMAAHTGRIITYDQMLKCDHEFAPGVDKLTLDGPPPLTAGPDGKYPVPQPGVVTNREY